MIEKLYLSYVQQLPQYCGQEILVQKTLWTEKGFEGMEFWDKDNVESTNVAPEVPHPRPTRPDAGRDVWRGCPCVGLCLRFFFLEFAPTQLDSCWIGFDSRRTELIRPKQAGNGRNRVKSALNMAGKAETCLLLSFFVNQGIVMCFLRIF